jgi:hypothetical protein
MDKEYIRFPVLAPLSLDRAAHSIPFFFNISQHFPEVPFRAGELFLFRIGLPHVIRVNADAMLPKLGAYFI